MEPPPEDERLLALAGAIGDGAAIDWAAVEQQPGTPDTTTVLQQLRILDRIAAVHTHGADGPERTEWGSLSRLRVVGRGGYGVVYRAFDADLQRDVALKVLGTGPGAPFDPDRLVREARLLARVRHPHVVTVYRAERHGDEVGIAMEYVDGETLSSIVRCFGPYSAREATVIGLDVCRALAAVHGAGLLHGDVKAHNVMREEGGRIVLMDFGAGRDLQPDGGVVNDQVGTPVYLAPEVFAGLPRSRASDIYSLGVLLFYLAAGSYPVEGDSGTQIRRQHAAAAGRRRLRDVRPDLPEAFIRVVERATAPDPAQRYQSAGELETDLLATLSAQEQTRAAEGGRGRRVAAAAVLLAVALGGAAYWRANRAASLSGTAAATEAAAIAAPYRIHAALYRAEGTDRTRLGGDTPLAEKDRLFLEVETSAPVYVYVVNEDDVGETFLLYPLGEPAVLRPGTPHRLPGTFEGQERFWEVSSAGGREHFLVFASPSRMPEFERVFARLPRPVEQPAVPVRVPQDSVDILRGVGGLVAAPPARDASAARLSSIFTTPLPAEAETVSGLWVRQLTIDNPAR